MHYVIVAKSSTEDGPPLQYLASDGFKLNLLLAARFRTEKDALRRCEKSIHCCRMKENGAHIEVRRVARPRRRTLGFA
jgi:hypothetical protein